MRLFVYVLEAKGLPLNSSYYLKLQVSKSKFKSRVVKGCSDPFWNEEFVFRVRGGGVYHLQLTISICCCDDNYDDDDDDDCGVGFLLGRVRVPVAAVAAEENQCMMPTWFDIHKAECGKYVKENCGKIRLALSLHGRGDDRSAEEAACHGTPSPLGLREKIPRRKKLLKAVASSLDKILHKNVNSSRSYGSLDLSGSYSENENCSEESSSCSSFEEAMEMILPKGGEQQMPDDLQGGILLDQAYKVSSKDLNALLFSSDSRFRKKLWELQGITDTHETPWIYKPGDRSSLTRVVTYTKPATKLVKAVKVTEEQMYCKAGGGEFAVLLNVKTPDVPYGNAFMVELLYKIMPGNELPSGEESSRLVVSWDINFCQSTMMRSMIKGGARQGLKENFDQFACLLSQSIRLVDPSISSEKDHVLQIVKREHQSNWELGVEYFWNVTAVTTSFLILYVGLHLLLCEPSKPHGMEINGLDLPDSLGELITSGILVLLLRHMHDMISHFIEARLQMGSDHGVEAKGDGWVVTVAVVEAVNLPSFDASGYADPFVVLTCNGRTRTSSVQLQTCNPQWNGVFDATQVPPSVLRVEVFNFDGPFDQAVSLGHTMINFLKLTSTELADMWIPLEGELAVSSRSKLHLSIFSDIKNRAETIKKFLETMEKGVRKKLKLPSPHKNSAFQKLFGMPPEEFFIKDYSCYLRRKIPLQGRLFLSARTVGFYSNLFGHKIKIFFLWEDIEDVEVHAPSIASVGSPTLIITLRKGAGLDAAHGATSQDDEGRLRFYFQSFASFDAASRTISVLWKMRNLALDEKALVTEDQLGQCSQLVPENAGLFTIFEVANMLKIHSADFQVDIKCVMKLFNGGNLEHKVMEQSGCLNYRTTKWEELKPGVYERQLSFKFRHHASIFGGDEVHCTQRKTLRVDGRGWIVNQVTALHGIPFGDHFHVHLRYDIEKLDTEDDACRCRCDVYLGVEWLKNGKFQRRIEGNINEIFTGRVKRTFELVKNEILLANDVTVL
ncbi:hypothetical protein Dimus_004694 [Dionaea muscipula]